MRSRPGPALRTLVAALLLAGPGAACRSPGAGGDAFFTAQPEALREDVQRRADAGPRAPAWTPAETAVIDAALRALTRRAQAPAYDGQGWEVDGVLVETGGLRAHVVASAHNTHDEFQWTSYYLRLVRQPDGPWRVRLVGWANFA